MDLRLQFLEEDTRATTKVQNGLVLFFLFSSKKALILRMSWGKITKKCGKCGKVWKSEKKV